MNLLKGITLAKNKDFQKHFNCSKTFAKSIFKIFTIFLITSILLFSAGCLESKKVVQIKAEIIEDNGPQFTNVEANTELIEALKYPKDIPPNLPGVYVLVIYANNRINYWTSVPYTGPGTYEITTGLRFFPADGEEARVIVTVNDETGDRIAMSTVQVTF